MSLKEKKSVKKNYFYNMVYQILLIVVPLVTMPYISRTLGSSRIGIVSYIESISSYFVLFATMGITTYGQREVSYYQDSKIRRSEIFWNAKVLEFITSLIVLILYIIFALFQVNKVIFMVLSINIIAVFFDVTWFFQGMEEFGVIILRNIIIKILQIIYFFIFIKSKEDVVLYALGLGLFTMLGNISLWGRLKKYVSLIPISYIKPFKDLKIVISLFIPTIAMQIYTVLDKTMIGTITQNPIENGYYEQASKISKLVLLVVTSLGAVLIPRIGYYFNQKNEEMVKNLMYKSYRFVFFLGLPLCIGLICCADNFVPWFLGDEFIGASVLIKILSFLILAIGMNNVTGMQYLIPTKRQNIFTLTVLIGAVTNFLLNLILIGKLQSVGAAIASVVSESVIAIIQQIIICSELSIKTIIKSSKNYVIASTLMLILLIYMGHIFSSSFVNTMVMVVSGAIFYFVILLLIKDEFFLGQLRVIIKNIFKR